MSYTTSRTKHAHWQRAHSGGAACLHLVLCWIEERAIRLAAVLVLYLLLRHLLHVLAEHIGRSIENIRRNSTLPAALPESAERVAAEHRAIEAGREHIHRQFFANHTIHLAEDFRVRESLILQIIVDAARVDSCFKWAARQRIASKVIRARLYKVRGDGLTETACAHAFKCTASTASQPATDANLWCKHTGGDERSRAAKAVEDIRCEAARIRQIVRISQALSKSLVLVFVQRAVLLLDGVSLIVQILTVIDEPITKPIPPRIGVDFSLRLCECAKIIKAAADRSFKAAECIVE